MNKEFFDWMDHRKAAQRQHAEIARITGVGNGRMLELYSGDGTYLSYFQEKSWECLGLETDETLANESMLTQAVPTLCGDPQEVAFPGNSYDVVRIRGALNHYSDPQKLVESAFYATGYTGFFITEVWNHNGFPCRNVSSSLTNTFNRKQLIDLAGSVGFEVGGVFAPAIGDSIWCPLHHQAESHIPILPMRLLDGVMSFFDRGSMLVLFAQKPPKDKIK
jgi:SAM-dependent methyltransferase